MLLERLDGLLNGLLVGGLVLVTVIPVEVLEAQALTLWSIWTRGN